MLSRLADNPHPFCRGLSTARSTPWFPRTSQRPHDPRWTVHSAAGQTRCFDREGWFLAALHINKPPDFVPTITRQCGALDREYVLSLHRALGGFFWKGRQSGR